MTAASPKPVTGQDVIWDHFQNEGAAAFDGALPRLSYLVERLRSGERVLNIGVGIGTLEMLADRKGVEVWSLDPSERAIAELRKKLPIGERAQAGYAQEAPFPSSHFDVVVMTEVIEHLDEETRTGTLREVHRMLRPGGRFIGTVPAREQLRLNEVVCPHCGEHFHRWGHQASFDVKSLRAILSGLFVVDTVHERFFNDWHFAPLSRRATGFIKKFLSWRGLGTYGVARNIYFSVHKEQS